MTSALPLVPNHSLHSLIVSVFAGTEHCIKGISIELTKRRLPVEVVVVGVGVVVVVVVVGVGVVVVVAEAFATNAIATMRKTKLEIVKVFILQLRIAAITFDFMKLQVVLN